MYSRLFLSVLALTLATPPAVAQDARACANEVERLAESFAPLGAGERLEQQPSARRGAALDDQQSKSVQDLIGQARDAGRRGDGALCLQKLADARVMLRQAGLGSVQPGSPTSGSGGTASGSGIPGVGASGGSASNPSGVTGGGGSGAIVGGSPGSIGRGSGSVGGSGGSSGGGLR